MHPKTSVSFVAILFLGISLNLRGQGVLAPDAAGRKPAASAAQPGLIAYDVWKAACNRLPANRALQGRLPPKNLLPLQRFADFEVALGAFLAQGANGPLRAEANWVGGVPADSFYNTNSAYFLKPAPQRAVPFQPFALKLSVPEKSEIFLRGDLHGDVHSLMSNLEWLNKQGYLQGFKVARPDFYMVFLGDYTDRGSYGIEVLYTLFRLKIENPDRVFLARGNHEEVSLQSRYGFLEEARGKYGQQFNAVELLRAYDFLPVVIYLGSGDNFVQCNHGGMEPGYSPRELIATEGAPRFQLLGALKQKTFLEQHPLMWRDADPGSIDLARRAFQDFTPDDPISPSVLGFMWNDYAVLSSEPQFAVDPGRAFVYGQLATRYLLEQAGSGSRQLRAVFRGHQQSSVLNPMMRRIIAGGGVFRHWQTNDSPALLNRPIQELTAKLENSEERAIPPGSVWTFNVSPDSVYGQGCDYDFDTFGLLRVAPRFEDWRLRRVNLPVKP